MIPILKSNSSDLMRILYQSYLPKILNVAIELKVFDTLSQKPLELSELSAKLNTDKVITEALLDVLIALELLTRQGGLYSLTQTAQDFLVNSSAANQINAVKNYSGSAGPFDNLADILKSGTSGFNSKMWSSREAIINMEQQQKGGAVQTVLSFIKEIPEFKNCKKMCDFAGSSGYFSFAFMQENLQLRSHVYDLPEVCALSREIKEKEEHFDRITYHDFDITLNESFGDGYDLFFSSHFLYEFNALGTLPDFFKKVYESMEPGGLFVSNHICPAGQNKSDITLSIIELMTRSMGYPTHQLSENDLKAALDSAGFGNFRTQFLEKEMLYPTLLLAATKQ